MGVQTILEHGLTGIQADIECHLNQGLPGMIIVGFASRAVDEARERIRTAFTSLPVPFPRKRIVINMAPADIPKHHTSYELAIAVSILEAASEISLVPKHYAFFGELGLDGSLRPVRGIVGALLSAKAQGLTTVFIPRDNSAQANLVPGLTIFACPDLRSVYEHLRGNALQEPLHKVPLTSPSPSPLIDIAEVRGQAIAKRALTIAAAGRHNLMLMGPPGTGKSMLAQAFISLLPPMSPDEILESTHIHSLSSADYQLTVNHRPLQAPHHSASDSAIIGGGRHLQPGAISLAHNGVLLLDEFPEFRRNALEALRQPLENHSITISRAENSVQFPANFILIATANPCPCGFYGSDRPCSCQPAQLATYRRKLSGPIMDRIDLFVSVENIDHQQIIHASDTAVTSRNIRRQVLQATARQHRRISNQRYNSEMTNKELNKLSNISAEAKKLLDQGAKTLQLSPRAYIRSLKVARTIADLEQTDEISTTHIAEALQYRQST